MEPDQTRSPDAQKRTAAVVSWKHFFPLVIVLIVLPAWGARADELPARGTGEFGYLFSSFRDNGQDGLHLAWSSDGLAWKALNHDKTYLRPQVGKEKLMRDPCILMMPDGTFHMVWTTSWYDRTIGYAWSKDLIHWSEQKAIPVMKDEPTARNCWAPELQYDPAREQFLIFWATTIPGRFPDAGQTSEDGNNHRIYCTTTKDFESFTPTRLFFDGGFNSIDATILLDGGKFHLIVKDERLDPPQKQLRYATNGNLYGPYTDISLPFTKPWVEGPTAIRIGDDVIVYFDSYKAGRYGAVRSKDWIHWEDISDKISFPHGSRHGTVLKVPGAIIQNLMKGD